MGVKLQSMQMIYEKAEVWNKTKTSFFTKHQPLLLLINLLRLNVFPSFENMIYTFSSRIRILKSISSERAALQNDRVTYKYHHISRLAVDHPIYSNEVIYLGCQCQTQCNTVNHLIIAGAII